MPRIRQIAINGSAGAFVDILATLFCRATEALEDDVAAATGLNVLRLEDGFVNTHNYAPANEPIRQGNIAAYGAGKAPVLGAPAQVGGNLRSADKLMSVRSRTAGATTLRFTEYE